MKKMVVFCFPFWLFSPLFFIFFFEMKKKEKNILICLFYIRSYSKHSKVIVWVAHHLSVWLRKFSMKIRNFSTTIFFSSFLQFIEKLHNSIVSHFFSICLEMTCGKISSWLIMKYSHWWICAWVCIFLEFLLLHLKKALNKCRKIQNQTSISIEIIELK